MALAICLTALCPVTLSTVLKRPTESQMHIFLSFIPSFLSVSPDSDAVCNVLFGFASLALFLLFFSWSCSWQKGIQDRTTFLAQFLVHGARILHIQGSYRAPVGTLMGCLQHAECFDPHYNQGPQVDVQQIHMGTLLKACKHLPNLKPCLSPQLAINMKLLTTLYYLLFICFTNIPVAMGF